MQRDRRSWSRTRSSQRLCRLWSGPDKVGWTRDKIWRQGKLRAPYQLDRQCKAPLSSDDRPRRSWGRRTLRQGWRWGWGSPRWGPGWRFPPLWRCRRWLSRPVGRWGRCWQGYPLWGSGHRGAKLSWLRRMGLNWGIGLAWILGRYCGLRKRWLIINSYNDYEWIKVCSCVLICSLFSSS